MWCKNNKCCYYNKSKNKCLRKGKLGFKKDMLGICWLEEEY